MKTEDYLTEIGKQEKQFDALYRNAGAMFGLPDCAMWVFYFLSTTEDELSQQDLIEKMMFPKQTINSAVVTLAKKGLLELSPIPGTRNKKKLALSEAGKNLANNTVVRMRKAECSAAREMGTDRMGLFAELYREFFEHLNAAFQKEGLAHEDE